VIESHAETTTADGKTEKSAASIAAHTTADARMSSGGSVASYEVVSTKKRDDGKYEVTVKAKVSQHVAATYNAPGHGTSSSSTRVAVIPPHADKSEFDFFGDVSGEEISSELGAATESALLRAPTFSILDRETLQVSLQELGLVGSSLTNEDEKAKLRKIRGADVLVLGTIHDAQHFENNTANQYTGGRVSHRDHVHRR